MSERISERCLTSYQEYIVWRDQYTNVSHSAACHRKDPWKYLNLKNLEILAFPHVYDSIWLRGHLTRPTCFPTTCITRNDHGAVDRFVHDVVWLPQQRT